VSPEAPLAWPARWTKWYLVLAILMFVLGILSLKSHSSDVAKAGFYLILLLVVAFFIYGIAERLWMPKKR
jgi:uncharacterized membrane protein YtjA (UPF0391 family)